jgi:acyl-CoA reductase-like NAD-dependent aldehyde dehydrogenase
MVPTYDKILIAGTWEPAARGTYQITNPATEDPAGFAPECSLEQVRRAARAAREAFERGPWPRLSGAERGAVLHKAADLFERERAGLLDLTMGETGELRVGERQQGSVRSASGSPSMRAWRSRRRRKPLPLQGSGRSGPALASDGGARPNRRLVVHHALNFPMTELRRKDRPALACGKRWW